MMAVLPDVLKLGLKVVFCGTSVGPTSAQVGAYYAGPGNQFWDVLFHTGLTPRRLQPGEFRKLPSHGIGLTDLAKKKSGTDDQVESSAFDVDGLRAKMIRFAPKALAFNGKKAGKAFCGHPVEFGRQREPVGDTVVYVLPSTSGAARGYWDESHWRDLARFVGSSTGESAPAKEGQKRAPTDPSPALGRSEGRSTISGKLVGISDSRVQLALKVDELIIRYLEEYGVEVATPKDLMPYLVRHGAFTKDHREGLPLRKLCRDLHAAGKLYLMTTAHFEQKAVNKKWYFMPVRTTRDRAE